MMLICQPIQWQHVRKLKKQEWQEVILLCHCFGMPMNICQSTGLQTQTGMHPKK